MTCIWKHDPNNGFNDSMVWWPQQFHPCNSEYIYFCFNQNLNFFLFHCNFQQPPFQERQTLFIFTNCLCSRYPHLIEKLSCDIIYFLREKMDKTFIFYQTNLSRTPWWIEIATLFFKLRVTIYNLDLKLLFLTN